jgi:hypothetical protein
MPDLVTVATFSQLEEAQIARARLESEEIESFLSGEAMAQTLWHLTNAIGGVKLQVAPEDAGRARTILDHPDEGAPAEEELSAEVAVDSAETIAREKSADRAYRGAIAGLVLAPVLLHVFSVFALIDYWQSSAKVEARARRRAHIAFAINVVVFAGFALLVWELHSLQ